MDSLNNQIQHQLNRTAVENDINRLNNRLDGLAKNNATVLKSGTQLSKADKLAKLSETAKEFEAIFFQQMLDAMDKTIDREDSLFQGGHGEKVFRGMMNQEIAKSAANTPGGSGFGLAKTIYEQMSRVLESQEATQSQLSARDIQG